MVMAYIVMGYIGTAQDAYDVRRYIGTTLWSYGPYVTVYAVMAYIATAHVDMANTITLLREVMSYSYGLYSHGLYQNGLYSDGLYSYVVTALCSYSLYGYGPV